MKKTGTTAKRLSPWRKLGHVIFTLHALAFVAAAAPPTASVDTAKANFAKADQGLNAAWVEAKGRLDPERMKEVTELQREWVKYRDQRALGADVTASGGSANTDGKVKGAAWYEMAARLSADRAAWLQRLTKSEDEPITGVWIDGKGGNLEVVAKDGKLYFDLNTVRGPGFDLGVIAGAGVWNSPLGWFSDKGRDQEKKNESNLAFIRKDLSIEIISANASHYHGNRAYLDGVYFKVASLSEGEAAGVVKAGETGKSKAVPD